MNKFRYYLVMFAFSLLVGAMVLAILKVIQGPQEAKITINMKAIDGYQNELEAAMSIWNSFVECEFLISTDTQPYDTLIKSGDGAPCDSGVIMRPKEEWGHAATAYDCLDGTYQILVEKPGHTNTQYAIIAHEIGERLKEWGVKHAPTGIMSMPKDPSSRSQNVPQVLDRDSKAIRKHFCYD